MEKKTTAAKPVVKTTEKEASKECCKRDSSSKICTGKRICERDSVE